jgi:LPXTG-motif cell wall-anchored protein
MIAALILAATGERPSLAESLLGFLPLLVFLAILYFFLRKFQNKNRGYMDRAMEHMDALEKKTDRMIELLEEIKKK